MTNRCLVRKITAQPDEIKPQECKYHSGTVKMLHHLFTFALDLSDFGSSECFPQHGWTFGSVLDGKGTKGPGWLHRSEIL